MPTIEQTITTTAGIEAVWAFLADFTTTEQWDPPTVSTVRVTGDGGVGTQYANTSRVWGHDTDIVYTVVEHDAPRRLRLEGRSDTFTAVDTIDLTDRDGHTVVTYTAEFSFTGAAKLATPLLGVGLEKIGHDAARQMTECLDRLSADPSASNAADRRRPTITKDTP
jgi:carbon monoxide dehydrogenase subunit G